VRSVWLTYHDVHTGTPSPHAPPTAAVYHLSRSAFEAQCEAIESSGRPVLSVGEFLQSPRPDSVVLTFDDGWKGAFANAVPALAARSWKATFFVTKDFVGAPGFADTDDLARSHAAGMEIGVHGTTHRMLSACPREEVLRELSDCREYLESVTGEPVELGSLPGGERTRTVVAAAREAGLRCLCTSRPGINRRGTSPYALRRVPIRATTTTADVERFCRFDIRREVARWIAFQVPRRVLGVRNYQRLRRILLGGGEREEPELFRP
jgi:peptidoglycan/xylan/chitin deacetylase (PgdA/CDA1 family)